MSRTSWRASLRSWDDNARPLYLDQISKMVIESWRQIAFDVDAGRRVLHKEIGGGNIVRDHSADVHRIFVGRFFRAELAHLIRSRQ
jgi:hypothetical protein